MKRHIFRDFADHLTPTDPLLYFRYARHDIIAKWSRISFLPRLAPKFRATPADEYRIVTSWIDTMWSNKVCTANSGRDDSSTLSERKPKFLNYGDDIRTSKRPASSATESLLVTTTLAPMNLVK